MWQTAVGQVCSYKCIKTEEVAFGLKVEKSQRDSERHIFEKFLQNCFAQEQWVIVM